ARPSPPAPPGRGGPRETGGRAGGRGGGDESGNRATRAPATPPPPWGDPPPMPVLDREEYIEQAYFFRAFRERLLDGQPSQEILAGVGEELLSTPRLPMAVGFIKTEIKLSGLMAPA